MLPPSDASCGLLRVDYAHHVVAMERNPPARSASANRNSPRRPRVAIATAACGPDKANYVRHNNAILDALPTPPGAERVGTESLRYKKPDCEAPTINCATGGGYTTFAIFKMNSLSPKEIVDFYVAVLSPDWSSNVLPQEFRGTTDYSVTFRRDKVEIAVNTGFLSAFGTRASQPDQFIVTHVTHRCPFI